MIGATPLALLDPWTIGAMVRILGYSLVAGITAVAVASLFRWLTRRAIPPAATVLVALAPPAAQVLFRTLTEPSIVGSTRLFHYASAAYLLGVFVAGTVTAEVGRRVGDYVACDLLAIQPLREQGPAAESVRSSGLATAVTLPATVENLEGYDPVGESTARRLSGKRLLFPLSLSDEQLLDRLRNRIEADFDVDHVHLELEPDGTVSEFAAGTTPSGVSPTLSPGSSAVAIEADPPADASVGDPVEVWNGNAAPVTTGTLRSTVEDVATLVVDAGDAKTLDASEEFRLLTRPDKPDDARELADRLWEAAAKVTSIEVCRGGRFEGEFAEWLPGRVLAIDRDGMSVAFPSGDRTLAAGDTVYLVGGPTELHRLSEYEPENTGEHAPSTVTMRETT